MTNLRSLSDVFRAAKKLAVACALATTVAAAALAQTNTFPGSGNAGVNTTSPPNPLTVARSGSAPYTSRPANELLQLVDKTDNTPQILFGSAYNGMILRYTGTETGANQRLGVITGGSIEAFVVNNDGNVGIGTTNPAMLLGDSNGLHISGSYPGFRLTATGSGGHDYFFGTGGSGQLVLYDNTSAATRMFFSSSGNVGIGTTSPTAKLHVSGSGNMQAIVESTTAAAELDLVSNAAGSGKWALGTGWSSAGSIRNLWFYDNVAAAIRLTIDSSGNVGIGKPDPQYKLDVVGDIKASGTIHAKYQDLAEWVPSSEQLAAGTVVVLDTTKSNQVVSSTTGYDTRVAGVISAQPGITLGEGGEGKVLVATTGRVKVKVDASRGAIQIGDLLVTSDVSGVAMKSEPVEFAGRKMHMPGTIIGKALEPLAKGSGEILVLLSLQ